MINLACFGSDMLMKHIRRFITYYVPYRTTLALDLFCAGLIGITGILFPLIIRDLTSRVFHLQTADVMISQLLRNVLFLFLLYIIEALAQYYMTYYGHVMGAKMEADMRSDLFSHLERLSFSYYDKNNTGHLVSRMINDLFDVTELAHHGPENIFISFIKLIGTFIILFAIHFPTTLVLLVTTFIMIWFTYVQNKRMRQTFMENRRRIADVNAILQDSLSGIRTVQSFSNEHIEQQKFDSGNIRFLESKRRNYLVLGQFHATQGFLQGLMYLSVVLAGGWFVVKGQLQATDMVMYILYINMFLDPIKRLVAFTEQFQKGMTGFERMVEVLDTDPEVETRPGALNVGTLRGNIRFEDVSFRYNEAEPVLEGINVSVPSRTTIALVGPSGAGKSTFCALIPRFYDVTAGRLTIDGIDVRDMTLQSLRANIGIVQQDIYIFNCSVRDNISYGNPLASDEEIELAAKRANIHDFIMTLPEGYDTLMGERGVRFSGGQKQRISIARVFLKNPPILILDEATSSLDNESEVYIQESLNELSKDRTTIVIAHRLSTIRNADEILVLTEDGIAERGTHDHLLAQDGIYARLYRMQFR